MSNSETPRVSQRSNKGIPPARFESFIIDKAYIQSQKQVMSQGNGDSSQSSLTQTDARSSTVTRTTNVQSQAQQSPNVESQPHTSRRSKEQTISSDYVSAMAREFDKKITAMQNEFQRQIHAIQELMISNVQQVNNNVSDLRNERRSEAINVNQRHEINVRESPANSENDGRSLDQRQKKIYPLPTFTGKPEEWQSFIESYRSTTTEFNYSNLHNIMRLREAISGKARETVEALLSNSANVPAILDILEETYGRPEQLIRSQIEKIRQITPIAEDRLDQLIDLANKITNMTTFLKNAKGEHHLSNPTLLSEMVGKLPITRQLQWAEKCLSLPQPATVVNFSEWLNDVRRIANMVSDSLPIMSVQKRPVTNISNFNNQSKYSGRKFVQVAVVDRKCIVCYGECSDLEHCKPFKVLSVDERWQKVRDLKVCFSCMKKGHRTTDCYKKKKCGINGCNRTHNFLLHKKDTGRTESNEVIKNREGHSTSTNMNVDSDHVSCHYNRVFTSNDVLFQVIPVRLYGNGAEVSVYAFIDDGSNATILDSEIANQLNVVGKKSTLELYWLNREKSSESTEIIELEISGIEPNAKKYKMANVYTSAKLSLPTQSFNANECVRRNLYLSKSSLPSYENVQPKMIISLSHAFLTVPIEVPKTGPGPIAAKTRLGCVVYGLMNNNVSKGPHRMCLAYAKNEKMEDLNQLVSNYFLIESFGIKPDIKTPMSRDDSRALGILEKTIKKINGRYEVGMLWKDVSPVFPDSLEMAMRRLEGIEKKMARDTAFADEYGRKIDEYIRKGYAERLSEREAAVRTATTFYIPHFGVKNPNKNSIRLVFDAAAEVKNISLNKMLLSGPDINQPLLAILFKFRQAPIAVTGDIEEMFHQISVRKEDRDSQRFIWRHGKSDKPVETYIMKRLIFGATCSPAVAQYVKNYNAKTYEHIYPRAVKGICERHYVDDYADCFQTENEAITVVKQVMEIHKKAGFNLRSINSNSEKVRKLYGGASQETVQIQKESERILGMHWLINSDKFVFKLKLTHVPKEILEFKRKPTKRELLKLHMSIFDPYGFLVDFMITAKIIMQYTWKAGIQWDAQIPDELYTYWKLWIQELTKIEQFEIPRLYALTFEKAIIDLHLFADASEQAMAVVAYWRVVEARQISVSFVCAKSRCAPIRYHTIPKLELQAAAMAARLKQAIVLNHSVSIRNFVFWTDSYTVLRWIRSDHKKYKQYVMNRVAEILEYSTVEQWRWCPGALNPADDGTRAKTSHQYNNDGRWKNGPEFLFKDETLWPQEEFGPQEVDYSNEEMRSKFMCVTIQRASYVTPNIIRFSKYSRYKRATAWILRYVENLKRRRKNQDLAKGPLTAEEENIAAIYLCRSVQWQVYSAELTALMNNKGITKDSPLRMLNPMVDEDRLLRCYSRLERAECLPLSTRRPIILPNDHPFTRLLVQYYHEKFQHLNVSTIMCEIRQTYWIPSIRRLVNTIQSNCVLCKLRKARPIQPQMSALPVDRVQPFVRPFTYTGVDYFGPFYVTIRRAREKRWVCLFTCLSIRAVHLEVAMDLSSDAFILCLRNFMNRRGVPLQLRSDNGTNFIGVAKELKDTTKFLDHDDITAKLAPLGIKWIYNTPANPAQGGAWERLVQSIKRVLYNMLKEEAPKLDTFCSLLIEAECIVNARPLTHLPVSPNESEPLTPNHFLVGSTNSTQSPSTPEPRLMCLRKQWRILTNLKNSFWKRWIREYLPELTRRSKWCLPTEELNKGSLVLICDADAPRSQWRRGRVIELYYGKDGVARSAEVKITSGVLRRPVSKLAVLDLATSIDDQ